MAYREVRMADIDQVIRRWLAGERIRAIARSTGADRNTVRRIVHFAAEAGIRGDAPWPDESKLQQIRQRMGRPGTTVAVGEAEERLRPRTDQIRAWLDKDHLLLTKVHELLGREGLVVSYSGLYRFAIDVERLATGYRAGQQCLSGVKSSGSRSRVGCPSAAVITPL